MASLQQSFTARLRQLRAERKMSQEALAEKAGISRVYLARMELGLHEPTLSMLEKLAKALKVTVGKLVE
jgi:transcriptional regulator with XRE-family HTH domain